MSEEKKESTGSIGQSRASVTTSHKKFNTWPELQKYLVFYYSSWEDIIFEERLITVEEFQNNLENSAYDKNEIWFLSSQKLIRDWGDEVAGEILTMATRVAMGEENG